MAKTSELENIYPIDFFNIGHPSNPSVDIQFRTSVGSVNKDVTTQTEIWESVIFDYNNFFNSMIITDNGGFQKINLSLVDRDFHHLERVITAAILTARVDTAYKGTKKSDKSTNDTDKYFQFYVDNSSSVNMRVRFGYNDIGDGFINTTKMESEEFLGRVKTKKTVTKSPWIYFMILNANYEVNDIGMGFKIDGISTSSAYIDRAKILVQGATLKGTPEKIIKDLGDIIKQTSDGNCIIEDFGEEKPVAKTNNSIIELKTLAGQPIFKNVNGVNQKILQYKSLKELLTEFCSNIHPKYFDSNGEEMDLPVFTEETKNQKIAFDFHHSCPFSYYVTQETRNKKIVNIIKFYYQDPDGKLNSQTMKRVYTWRNNDKSLITNFNISTKNDFAQMNSPITINVGNGNVPILLGSGTTDEENDSTNPRVKIIESLYEAAKKNTLGVTFTSGAISSESKGDAVAQFLDGFVANLNKALFTGSLEMPLDPFYLFDTSVKPFVYKIGVIVNRPNYINKNNERVIGGKSHLSGSYVIKSITHTINGSDAKTSLEIMRWPEV